MLGVEASREIDEEATRYGDVGRSIRALEDGLDLRARAIRQMVEDVAQLVHLAALHQSALAESVADGLPQRFRAIEKHEHTPVGAEPATLEIRVKWYRRRAASFRLPEIP